MWPWVDSLWLFNASSSNSYTRPCKFYTVWPLNTRKLIASQLYNCICDEFCETCMSFLVSLQIRLVQSQLPTFVLVLQTCWLWADRQFYEVCRPTVARLLGKGCFSVGQVSVTGHASPCIEIHLHRFIRARTRKQQAPFWINVWRSFLTYFSYQTQIATITETEYMRSCLCQQTFYRNKLPKKYCSSHLRQNEFTARTTY